MPPVVSLRSQVIRASEHRITNFREELQNSYMRAICAAAGCNMSKPDIDEGVDWNLTHTDDAHVARDDRKARLEVQLKTTVVPPHNGFIRTRMSRERYDEYRISDPAVPKLVIIMSVPQDRAHWVFTNERGLTLHRRAYWVNLDGKKPSSSTTDVEVQAPLSQVMNDVTLCQIMERIGKGRKP